MAKIEWVFQDESGTNLNRYIATNVDTGERITFDLLRGGNISIVGTPLNASNLNSLITAINENYDEIATLKTSVSTNTNNIKNLQSSVSTNTTNISILTQKVKNIETLPVATTRKLIFNPLIDTISKFNSNLVFKQSHKYIIALASFRYDSSGSIVLTEDYFICGQIIIDIPKLTSENVSFYFEAGTVSSTDGLTSPRYFYIKGSTSGLSTSLKAYYVGMNSTNKTEIKDFSETITIGRVWEETINII